MKKLIFSVLLSTLSMCITAQDTIRMTWIEEDYYMYSQSFGIGATIGEQIVIDWGDGNIDTVTSNGNQLLSHVYNSYYKQYTLTLTGLTEDFQIFWFGCNRQYTDPARITDLSINSNALYDLNCLGNLLSKLDISELTALTYLSCEGNRFPLSELYTMYKHPNYPRFFHFGQQFLLPQETEAGVAVDFSTQAEFDGIATVFNIRKNNYWDSPADTNDYRINKGMILFKDTGTYFVRMTNSAMKVSEPAEVFAEIHVVSNATLSDLSVSAGELSPAFSNIIYNYYVEVGYDTTEITISAFANDTNTIVGGDIGLQQLQVGKNVFTVTAESEQGRWWNYIVIVNRKSDVGITEVANYELQVTSYEIYNIVGQLLLSLETLPSLEQTINTLPSGIYIIRQQTNNGILTKKIIINK